MGEVTGRGGGFVLLVGYEVVGVVVCGAGGVSFGLDEETRGRALSLSVLSVRLSACLCVCFLDFSGS